MGRASVVLPSAPITAIHEYLAAGGGEGLRAAHALGPHATIEELTASGLPGRGGAGFPTGAKWASVRAAGGGTHYPAANGAEGEPATFKDRTLMRADPCRIEGLAIAAFCVGAPAAYVGVKRSFAAEAANLRRAAVEPATRPARRTDDLDRRRSRRVPVRRGKSAARGDRGARSAAPPAAAVAARPVRHRDDGLGGGHTGSRQPREQPHARQQRRDVGRGSPHPRPRGDLVPLDGDSRVGRHRGRDGGRRRVRPRCARGRARYAARRGHRLVWRGGAESDAESGVLRRLQPRAPRQRLRHPADLRDLRGPRQRPRCRRLRRLRRHRRHGRRGRRTDSLPRRRVVRSVPAVQARFDRAHRDPDPYRSRGRTATPTSLGSRHCSAR